jgi:hypothetical protein
MVGFRMLSRFVTAACLLGPIAIYAQNDACKTVNIFHKNASCQHSGAGCNVGSGPGTGHCVFLKSDGLCDCEPNAAPPPPPTITGVVQNPLSSPVYVNLYWDANWDADHPTLPQRELDAFMTATINSSYFGGLTEYGVNSSSYGGGVLPAPSCPQKAPSDVGFYDPTGTSISGFLKCEMDHGGLPQGGQVVYNIILPTGSRESDLFGQHKLCDTSAKDIETAWHFHQIPQTPQGILGIGLGVLGIVTGGALGALEVVLGAVVELSGGPIYTISSADPACGMLTKNLFHEMVEAATDPFPSVGVILDPHSEIVDIADAKNCPAASPFVPPSSIQALPASPNFPSFDRFTTGSTISVPQYWSNAQQKCLAGNDSTTPAGLKVAMSGNGATLALTITGTGFGTLFRTSSAVPYIAIQNNTRQWQAGNSLNSDAVTLNIASWTDTSISINGFNFVQGNLIMLPNDNLSIWVCNPQSGQCGGASIPLVESGAPQLNITTINANNVSLFYDIKVDGNLVFHALPPDFSTGWKTFTAGAHVVSETSTVPGFSAPDFRSGCGPNGNITLAPGDNQVCLIFNVATTQCSTGQHCCSIVNSKVGCSGGCAPAAEACQALCPANTNKCCGSQLPSGKCDSACVNSPKQSCP